MRKLSVLAVLGLHTAAASVFAGRVVEDHSGNPIGRAEIHITRPQGGAVVAELETDGQGRFRTPELPDSVYTFRFSKADYSAVEVTTGARSDMRLRLTRFGAIAGKISDGEGHPVYAQVVALTPSDAIAGTEDPSAGPGEYRIYDLPAGKYQVAILTSGEWPGRHGMLFYPNNSGPREFEVSGGEDYSGADFTLSGGPAFRISAKTNGTQTGSIFFSLIAADHPGRQLAQEGVSPDRAFTVENVRPGRYEVLASAPSPGNPTLFSRTPVTVVAADVEDVRIPLDQARTAQFTVRGLEPCAASATVELKAREGWLLNRPVSAPLQEGEPANLTALAPARYSVSAKVSRGNCYAIVPPDLDLTRESASSPVEVLVTPAGSIQGSVTGSADPTKYVVVLSSRDGSLQRIAFPDERGNFTFPDLAPGRYFALAAGPDTHWSPAGNATAVEIRGGAPTAVELHVSEVAR
jgi:hypothetical protein